MKFKMNTPYFERWNTTIDGMKEIISRAKNGEATELFPYRIEYNKKTKMFQLIQTLSSIWFEDRDSVETEAPTKWKFLEQVKRILG